MPGLNTRTLAILAAAILSTTLMGVARPAGRAIAAPVATPPGVPTLIAARDDGAILRAGASGPWRQVQFLDGAIYALVAAPAGRVLYAATSAGSVWRSGDGGLHWSRQASPGADSFNGATIVALALNPSAPDVVYAATGSGLSQSLDGGASWLLVSGLPNDTFTSVDVDAQDPASVWAGTGSGALYHSTDGGSTWTPVTGLYTNVQIWTISVSPASSDVIYAGTGEGLFQSVDGGATWVQLTNGLDTSGNIVSVAVSPRQPDRVYAATGGGVYVSADGGSTWTQSSDPPAMYISAVVADPHNALVAYAATDAGIYRTDDGGATWSEWNSGDLAYNSTRITALALTAGAHTPAEPAAPACCGARYFSQTQHNMSGPFLAFYRTYGGLDAFGYPRTEIFIQDGHPAQYTDRFLLEWIGGRVVTAPLGRALTAGRDFPPVAPFPGTADRVYFGSTGHSLSGLFLRYWRSHHGSLLLGAPIAEPDQEANGDGTGRVYLVQWFAKGRLEYHPELAGTRYVVELGLVGKQDLLRLGWLP